MQQRYIEEEELTSEKALLFVLSKSLHLPIPISVLDKTLNIDCLKKRQIGHSNGAKP